VNQNNKNVINKLKHCKIARYLGMQDKPGAKTKQKKPVTIKGFKFEINENHRSVA